MVFRGEEVLIGDKWKFDEVLSATERDKIARKFSWRRRCWKWGQSDRKDIGQMLLNKLVKETETCYV